MNRRQDPVRALIATQAQTWFVLHRAGELTAAQRQLLRMGPRNVRIVQAKLREVAGHLGIPGQNLPPERVHRQ